MKRVVFLAVVALALGGVFGGSPAYAQDVGIAKMPFNFVVDNREMPAGTYELTVSDQGVLMLTPQPKGKAVFIPVITRLAQLQVSTEFRIVFDKVGEKYYVSEVWFPSDDGFLVKDTKEAHTHHVVKGERKS